MRIPPIRLIAVVISDSPEAYALERAEKMGIPHYAIARQDYVDKPSFEAAIDKTLREAGVGITILRYADFRMQ